MRTRPPKPFRSAGASLKRSLPSIAAHVHAPFAKLSTTVATTSLQHARGVKHLCARHLAFVPRRRAEGARGIFWSVLRMHP